LNLPTQHKQFTDKVNLLEIAQDFVTLHEERKRYFDNFFFTFETWGVGVTEQSVGKLV